MAQAAACWNMNISMILKLCNHINYTICHNVKFSEIYRNSTEYFWIESAAIENICVIGYVIGLQQPTMFSCMGVFFMFFFQKERIQFK